jgi:type IV fimbrial biogenesis protein FimT
MDRCARPWNPAGQRGVTLIELVVVLMIVAVAATLAAPNAAAMIANRRVQGAAQSVLEGLAKGRSEAVRRNVPVRFTISGPTGWTLENASSSATIESFNTADWSKVVIGTAPSTSVTFLPNGLIQASGTPMSQVTVSSGVANTRTRQINIFGGGLIRMCDPATTAASDPRKC